MKPKSNREYGASAIFAATALAGAAIAVLLSGPPP